MPKHHLIIDLALPLAPQFAAIPKQTQELTISQHHTRPVTAPAFSWLTKRYAQSLPPILSLNLANNQFGNLTLSNADEQAQHSQALSEFIAALPTSVTSLNLANNGLGNCDVVTLLQHLPLTVKRLYLKNNCLGAWLTDKTFGLQKAFAALEYLAVLDLENCFPANTADYASGKKIAEAIPLNISLIKVHHVISQYLLTSLAQKDDYTLDSPWLVIHPALPRLTLAEAVAAQIPLSLEQRVIKHLVTLMEFARRESAMPKNHNRFMHWWHHSDKSLEVIDNAIRCMHNFVKDFDEVMELLTGLMKRHGAAGEYSTSGLHTNSFDTIFMQLLWASAPTPAEDGGILPGILSNNFNLDKFARQPVKLHKETYRFGSDAENLSGENRLPVKDRAVYRAKTLAALEEIFNRLNPEKHLAETLTPLSYAL